MANMVGTPIYNNNVIEINNYGQRFENVPIEAWEYFVGSYQPMQKWLKDRRGRRLEDNEIARYMEIIRALERSSQVMKLIDNVVEF